MTQPQNTTFLILAGGIGKRFAPFVTNKTLVPVLGRPLLVHTLEQIARVGGTEVVIVTNESNQAWLQSYKNRELHIQTVIQPEASGMGTAVLAAAPLLQQGPVVIMNAIDQVADPLDDENLQVLKDAVIENKADFGIAPDGDSDRIFFVDDKGQTVRQEILRGIMAQVALKEHPGATVCYDIRPGKITQDMIEEVGGKASVTRVGHSLIKAQMLRENAVFGGESSGHYFYQFKNGTYEAPVVFILKFLEYLTAQSKPFSEIVKQQEYFPGGYLELDQDRVVSIIEKPKEGEQPSNLINLVFHYFADLKPLLNNLTSVHTDRDDVYEVALDHLMKETTVNFVPYAGFWQPVKYPHMLLDVIEVLLSNVKQQSQSDAKRAELGVVISPQAVIEGPVLFGSNVVVEAGAVIKGPSYIGDSTIVGTNSLVRNSCIEADCIVGFGSEVARSYVGPGTKLHHNFIGDSVLEGNCNPSWGTCLANWRIDSQLVRVSYPTQVVQTQRQKLGTL